MDVFDGGYFVNDFEFEVEGFGVVIEVGVESI